MPRNGPFVKPLIHLSKSQIQQYLKKNSFDWREDASNAHRKYKRNAVRLDLLPTIEKLSGGADAFKRW